MPIKTNAYPSVIQCDQEQSWKEIEDVLEEHETTVGGEYDPLRLNTLIKAMSKEKKSVIEARCKERNIKVKPGRKMIDSNKFIYRSKAKISACKVELYELQKSNKPNSLSNQQKLRN